MFKRNWSVYNESLIERGHILIDLGLIKSQVHMIQNIGYDDRYKKLKDIGQRWIAEVVFSSLKRVLGEHLLSKKFTMQKIETTLKIMLYNRFMLL